VSLSRIGTVLAITVGLAQPQTPRPTLKFDVASIKPSGPRSVRGSDGGPGSKDPGRYVFNSSTLQDLIAVAYHVEYFQILSKTPLDRERFDLLAKLPEGTTKEQFRDMMKDLLAERFHLKLHVESKEFPAYEMIVAKSGPKMKESVDPSVGHEVSTQTASRAAVQERVVSGEAGGGFPELPPDRPGLSTTFSNSGGFTLVRTRARQQTMAGFAARLQAPDGRHIVDRTGLTGKYDFTLEYTTDRGGAPPAGEAPVAPSPLARRPWRPACSPPSSNSSGFSL
jgi:uncharacterized protein (TIGR03435 family)